ncbi:MAG: IS200/IS605 family transposase [Calditrichia bacterium]|nr:IS200/IS605 family transposase [Calditrichia bacterium]
MANSYTKIYIQCIFTVKGRKNFLPLQHNTELHNYIKGIVEKRKSIVIAVNNMQDHVHILVRLNPNYSVSKLMQEIKSVSSKFINDNKLVKGKFQWQSGYGAFSYSESHVENVIKYIENQEQHHQNRTFREEFIDFLEKFKIEYDDKYLFEFYD